MASLDIAWIGTGVMGSSMARHLMAAGHRLRVHTRTRERAQPLLEAGAHWAESPAEAAEGAVGACSMVGYPEDVDAVHLGQRGTLAAAARPGLLIDFTTSSPAIARCVSEAAAAHGIESLDAPVSGGDVGARNATLSVMCGGSVRAFERAAPILGAVGKTIVHQ
ncbi:MAG: NAD(P)-binding domain-containing protein, partial [Phycisphaerales bacterium]